MQPWKLTKVQVGIGEKVHPSPTKGCEPNKIIINLPDLLGSSLLQNGMQVEERDLCLRTPNDSKPSDGFPGRITWATGQIPWVLQSAALHENERQGAMPWILRKSCFNKTRRVWKWQFFWSFFGEKKWKISTNCQISTFFLGNLEAPSSWQKLSGVAAGTRSAASW